MAEATLEFVVRQLDRVLAEMAGFRDELLVQTAIIRRLDATVDGLKDEVMAIHLQNARLDKRLRKLEDAELA